MNYEEDIGIYTIKAATDLRTCNRTVTCRPSTNIITQLELISKWEKKTGKNFKKIHVSEEEVVARSESKPNCSVLLARVRHYVFARYIFVLHLLQVCPILITYGRVSCTQSS